MYLNDYNMLLSDLGVVQGQEASDYNKYLTDLNQFNTDRDFDYGAWLDRYNMLGNNLQAGLNMDAQELERYLAELQQYNADRDFAYGQLLDEINDQTNDFGTLVDMAQLAAGYGDYRGLENLGIQLPTPTDYVSSGTGTGTSMETSTPTSSNGGFGTSYNTIWSRARTMFDEGRPTKEILAYLDRFNETQLTDAGLDYIMNSLNLNGYREAGG